MSSTTYFTVSPASLQKDRLREPHYTHVPHYNRPATPADSQHLSPYSSQLHSDSASPDPNSTTPAESIDSISVYQAGDLDDPFFGVNFNDPEGGAPSFLDDDALLQTESPEKVFTGHIQPPKYHVGDDACLPLSAHKSMFTGRGQGQDSSVSTGLLDPAPSRGSGSSSQVDAVSLEPTPTPSAPQLTPDSNGEGWSSDDSLAPAHVAMASQSPRVTVSMWGKDGEDPVHTVERSFSPDLESPKTLRPRASANVVSSTATTASSSPKVSRDTQGRWSPDSALGHGGLAPGDRPSVETLSANELAKSRQLSEKNEEVADWVLKAAQPHDDDTNNPPGAWNDHGQINIPPDETPWDYATANRMIPGQTYYRTDSEGGRMTQADLEIIHQTRSNWADAPRLPHIFDDQCRYQPESSQAAIAKFERMCRDNDSIVSHAATWGTRRKSLPSVMDEEGILNGSFLKRLTIRGDSHSPRRRPSLLRKIPDMVRRTSASQILKRKGSHMEMSSSDEQSQQQQQSDRRGSQNSLATPSWSIRQKSMPSLNTAIVGMATSAASIGASHARSGSISATTMTSPKSPFAFQTVRSTLRRSRSKTETPRIANQDNISHPNIIGMLKQAGGPPVAQLARSQPTMDPDDDDDDDDETFDDSDMKILAGDLEEILPTFEGFQRHILRLNPGLANENRYLVDRIAHQMIVRYKNLQNLKIKHLKAVNSHNCGCGPLCIEQGGMSTTLDSRGDTRGVDPLSARTSSDDNMTPIEGGISAESFPAGIPMPPTTSLPAEIECQLCYSAKKFQKPSDWTKHVHEDVQPFTCTWDRCRDPKMFKRKADWVRHENEGHRHLEWWTCDVEECRHTCYRRDNFLQHLVREHKFTEPKVKTKAAIKKAGGGDLTWQMVEKCHHETQSRPQDEPCRFCGKSFPTWKKLTVHLAKHMEHISLPVLGLVAAKDLREDTIISPVQDLPPRAFSALPSVKQEPQAYTPPQRPHAMSNPTPVSMQESPQAPFNFQNVVRSAQIQSLPFNQRQPPSHFHNMSHGQVTGLMMPQVNTALNTAFSQPQFHTLPVTAGPTFAQPTNNTYMPLQTVQSHGIVEPFPTFNALGLPDTTGGQMGFDGLADPSMHGLEHYSPSVSPYSHSPQQGHNPYFNQ